MTERTRHFRKTLAAAFVIVALNATLLAVAWALGAFVSWDANPGHWNVDGRGFLALFWLVTAICLTGSTVAVLAERGRA